MRFRAEDEGGEMTPELKQAMLELCVAVGNHPDSMFEDGPLHAPFVKAVAALQKVFPPKTLTDAIEVSIPWKAP